jgi:thermitase
MAIRGIRATFVITCGYWIAFTGSASACENSASAIEVQPTRQWIARPVASLLRDQAADALVADAGGQVLRTISATGELIVIAGASVADDALVTALIATGDFQYVVNDPVCYPANTPNDPEFSQQWQHVRMESELAWDLVTGSSDVIVAVVDGGIDLDHPDLMATLVPGYNAVSRLAQDSGGIVDDVNGHGTAVAGCAAAIGNNGVGVVGIGWNLGIMPIRASNSQSGGALLSDLLDGARWAVDHGAAVVNVSYSGVSNASVETTGQYIISQGGLLCWAAGNSNQNLSGFDHPSVIVVGSSTIDDERAPTSSFGRAVDVFAPGYEVRTTALGGGYEVATGTSFATPHAAGVAAMIMSVAAGLSPGQVNSILERSCDDLGDPGEDDVFGFGRVNTRRAVQMAMQAACPADIDLDGAIGLSDLALLLADFGATAPPSPAGDLNGDGAADLSDLALLLAQFGTSCR